MAVELGTVNVGELCVAVEVVTVTGGSDNVLRAAVEGDTVAGTDRVLLVAVLLGNVTVTDRKLQVAKEDDAVTEELGVAVESDTVTGTDRELLLAVRGTVSRYD